MSDEFLLLAVGDTVLFNFLIPPDPFPFAIYAALLPSSSYIVNTLFLLTYSQLFEAEIDERRLLPVTLLLVVIDFVSLLFLALVAKVPYLLYRLFSVPADLVSYLLLGFVCVVEGLILAHVSSLAFLSVDKRTLSLSWIFANTVSIFVYLAKGGVSI
ncbi:MULTISPECIES: hypothetical protein [unclassified Archaeoglobus]|uniref:hypothetical protein n=1 Tax=unclassified Archaeoglobus TaxID=2643606 RepID=UPI0025C3F2B0|nr:MULTISPECIES: hypothetical protein [unclassified Archaeoglobus]